MKISGEAVRQLQELRDKFFNASGVAMFYYAFTMDMTMDNGI